MIQEFIPVAFLQVQNVHVSRLTVKLPGITRLSNDPVHIFLEKVTVELEEPVVPRTIETPLTDFLNSSNKKTTTSTQVALKKYGFTDRMIDGIRIRVDLVDVYIKTLGQSPSKQLGEWYGSFLTHLF